MFTRLRAAIVAALLALFLIGSDVIPRVIAEDGTLMNLVGRVDSVTHALAVTSVSATGTDIPGALSGLVGATDSTTRALKVYFDTSTSATVGNLIFGTGASKLASPSDGVVTISNNAATDFTRLQFGGTTSSFPALKKSGTALQVRLADDSGYGAFSAAGYNVSSSTLISGVAPTVSSGFGTSPTIANNNGTAAFTVNVGTGGVATSGVVGLPTATTGWNCFVSDITAAAAHVAYDTRQTASTTTSVTLENQTTSTGAAVAWAASDILRVSCFAY